MISDRKLVCATVITGCVTAALATGWPRLHVLTQNVAAQIAPSRMTLPYPAPPPPEEWKKLSAAQRLADARKRLSPLLDSELSARGARLGDHAFIRIFKESKELELWLRPDGASKFTLFRNYPISVFSGVLGPKLKEGDMQAPEGFYSVPRRKLNPSSRYHLSFDIGYPNDHDRFHQRTGGLIMVHGSNVSIGCFAMTDPVIEEIYLVIEAALASGGQIEVPVHVFPFRMTAERMSAADAEKNQWLDFWRSLKPGYDAFEKSWKPPAMQMSGGRYEVKP